MHIETHIPALHNFALQSLYKMVRKDEKINTFPIMGQLSQIVTSLIVSFKHFYCFVIPSRTRHSVTA